MGIRSTNTTQSFGSDFYRSGSDVTRAYVNQVYTEDVFHTYIPETATSDQPLNIDNSIDFATHGGLIWLKRRNGTPGTYTQHALIDTERGADTALLLPSTNGNQVLTGAPYSSSFDSDGFTWGSENNFHPTGADYVSWSFRKQPGFFDIVTWDGDQSSSRGIAHNLQCVPGFIIVKCTSDAGENWNVYHRSAGPTKYFTLDTQNALNTSVDMWQSVNPTSTHFIIGQGGGFNQDGRSYVAYLFAHDDHRFGDFEDQDIIKCGKITMPASGDWSAIEDLGWEPQWILTKEDANSQDWAIFDSRRGIVTGTAADPGNEAYLAPSNNSGESGAAEYLETVGNGFRLSTSDFSPNFEVYYVAIRKGIKKPTDATKVFNPKVYQGTFNALGLTQDFAPVDLYDGGRLFWTKIYTGVNNGTSHALATNKTGPVYLQSDTQGGETAFTNIVWDNPEFVHLNAGSYNSASNTHISWNFKTAAGFFDIVTYEGTGTNQDQTPNTVYHSLGVKPELIMCKRRDNTSHWVVWSDKTFTNGNEYAAKLNTTGNFGPDKQINTVTSTTFNAILDGAYQNINVTGSSNIALLFASCPGVSKIGTYSGNTGNNVDIDCGFTSNARFVMIKRTDSEITTPSQQETNWWIFGENLGYNGTSDYALRANTADARVSGIDWLSWHPDNKGFRVNSGAIAALNATGGTYLYLAIA